MKDGRDLVWKALVDAFPDEPIPNGRSIAATDVGTEAEEETNPFLGRRWKDVSGTLCLRHWDALSWMRPDAYIYYLPAFLWTVVENYIISCSSNIVDGVLSNFISKKERWYVRSSEDRLLLLNQSRFNALIVWINYLEQIDENFAKDYKTDEVKLRIFELSEEFR